MALVNGEYKKYELDNGLVVALQNTPTKTVSAKLRINSGSFHEEKGEEGLAHFLEHCLVMGGSEKYDPLAAEKIRSSFGGFNAFTSIGRTCFVGDVLIEDIGAWLGYVSDHALNPAFGEKNVNCERERVLREISDTKSVYWYKDNQEFRSALYGDHPKGIFNLGKEEVVKNSKIAKLKDFHSKRFGPNNMDLILAGNLPENIEETINNYFGNAARGINTRIDFPEVKPLERKNILHRSVPEKYNIDNPEDSSTQLLLASILPADQDPDIYAIRTMSHILGTGMDSLLFKNMSLKKGLAYNVGASYSGDYNCGELSINADVPAGRINEAVDVFFQEFKRIKTQKMSDEILNRVKKSARFHLLKTFETNQGHISNMETILDYGTTLESLIGGVLKVTPEKVLEVANKYLPDQKTGDYVLYIGDPLKA